MSNKRNLRQLLKLGKEGKHIVDIMFEKKDIKGLKQELRSVEGVIKMYEDMLYNTASLQHKERYTRVLSEEKKLRDKIESYLFGLLNNYI